MRFSAYNLFSIVKGSEKTLPSVMSHVEEAKTLCKGACCERWPAAHRIGCGQQQQMLA
jgi:hypothetical protein